MNQEQTNPAPLSWKTIITGESADFILGEGLNQAARNLSMMVDRLITTEAPVVKNIPIGEVVTYDGSPETEVVGVYLLIEGELRGQALLLIPVDDAMYLVDLLMGEEPGSTTDLDELNRSALAEVGNLTVSGFLNAIAEQIGKPSWPSPPAVIVDMRGAILTMIISLVAAFSDEMLVIETAFKDADRTLRLRFWVLPDPSVKLVNLSKFK